MNNYGWSGGVRDVGESPTHAPATKISPFYAPAQCIAGAGERFLGDR